MTHTIHELSLNLLMDFNNSESAPARSPRSRQHRIGAQASSPTGGPLHRLLSAATEIDILAIVRVAHHEAAGHAPSLGSTAGRPILT